MLEHRVRLAVFEWLATQVRERGDVLSWSLLLHGVEVDGRHFPLVSQRGIWQPRVLRYPLSILTSSDNPYHDDFRTDSQLEYHYFGNDPEHPNNVGLRNAMADRVPLVHLYGVASGRYVATWPVFVRDERPSEHLFVIEADDARIALERFRLYQADWHSAVDADPESEGRRIYVTREVRQRLHQRSFRERVLAAYGTRCAICRLRHERLLDAAHIIGDTEERGEPLVRNGLSLCKLHHAAFDGDLFGIRPDHEVEVRPDVRSERDGPMLVHALQGIHGQRIHVPRAADKQPDPERLAERYRRFRAAC
ncbi:MAG: HNH endonuclease [Acidobacteria bacterium]|nr:HNH endonuclease [Acidobacteriota bacterium]